MGEARLRVELTEEASRDLYAFDDYWTLRGEAWRGEKYYDDLRNFAEQNLSDRVVARHGRRIKSERHPDAREILAFGVYRIIYEIDDTDSFVTILSFWHAHRDDPRREL